MCQYAEFVYCYYLFGIKGVFIRYDSCLDFPKNLKTIDSLLK